jgi:hypothetical protein
MDCTIASMCGIMLRNLHKIGYKKRGTFMRG